MITNNDKGNAGDFCINVNSPGNFIAREITFTGTVNIGGHQETGGFSDEQIIKALKAIVGKDKPISNKHKWAGAYWWLRWACNFPVDVQEFCNRIKALPGADGLEISCDYENIRKLATLSFMNQDPRQMDKVKVSNNERTEFFQYREVALKLGEELGKIYLPSI